MPCLPSTLERKWPDVIIPTIAVANYVVTVASTKGLHTKQIVDLSLLGQESKQYEIKRVLSETELRLGPVGQPITVYANPTNFNGGTLAMSEQNRNAMGFEVTWRAVYEEEPAVALRSMLVDYGGCIIDTVTGPDGLNRLAVDTTVTVPTVEINIDDPDAPIIININVINPLVEHIVVLPLGTKRYLIKSRKYKASLRLAFIMGDTATNYLSIDEGLSFYDGDVSVKLVSKPIYLLADKPSVIEVLIWVDTPP